MALFSAHNVGRVCAYFWACVIISLVFAGVGMCYMGLVQLQGWILGTLSFLGTIVGVMSIFGAFWYAVDSAT